MCSHLAQFRANQEGRTGRTKLRCQKSHAPGIRFGLGPGRMIPIRQRSTPAMTPGPVKRGTTPARTKNDSPTPLAPTTSRKGTPEEAARSIRSMARVTSRPRPKKTGAWVDLNGASPQNGEPFRSVGQARARCSPNTFSSIQPRNRRSKSCSNSSVVAEGLERGAKFAA